MTGWRFATRGSPRLPAREQAFPETIWRERQGSRIASGLSRHPQAARSDLLRSYVVCDLCGRRMSGKTCRDLANYAREPDQRHRA